MELNVVHLNRGLRVNDLNCVVLKFFSSLIELVDSPSNETHVFVKHELALSQPDISRSEERPDVSLSG